jgi:hypothetical protein
MAKKQNITANIATKEFRVSWDKRNESKRSWNPTLHLDATEASFQQQSQPLSHQKIQRRRSSTTGALDNQTSSHVWLTLLMPASPFHNTSNLSTAEGLIGPKRTRLARDLQPPGAALDDPVNLERDSGLDDGVKVAIGVF